MKDQWIAMEHYRMHSVEEWPESPQKQAALAAIRSALDSLARAGRGRAGHGCSICQSRKIVELPQRPALDLAA